MGGGGGKMRSDGRLAPTTMAPLTPSETILPTKCCLRTGYDISTIILTHIMGHIYDHSK